jgi:hypothetical protein
MKRTNSFTLIPYAGIAGLALIVWASIGLAAGISESSPGGRNQPVIRVEVYNYAHIGRLEHRQAADIFAAAGDRIVWIEFSDHERIVQSSSDDSAPDLFGRILKASAISRVRRITGPDVMGEAIVGPKVGSPIPGRTANVFYDRVQHVSSLWGLFPGQVLGDAIAHELGHLLGVRHSSRGIMKSNWTLPDLRLANRGELQFLPAQATLIETAALSLHPDFPSMVLAQR